MTKLCVSIAEEKADQVIGAFKALPPEVDMAEVRLDYLTGSYTEIQNALRRICSSKNRPLIITNRPASEGGKWTDREDLRLKTLSEAARLGADYIDIELAHLSSLQLADLPAKKIISYHNFEKTPTNIELIYRQCRYAGADVIKIATMASDISDSAAMLSFLDTHSKDASLIALTMGEEGVPTRILGPKFGAFLSFATRNAGGTSAPGQLPLHDMLHIYRFKSIGPDTDFYGVMADPVAHSMSPAIHNAAFAFEGMNAVYLPFRVKQPSSFMNDFQALGLKGLSVTIPHKETMMTLMDEVDETARRVGALNTVNIVDNRRFGSNTDVAAALSVLRSALKKKCSGTLSECRVLLIGAGGAGRALAHGLAGNVRELIVSNRTFSRARKLAAEIGASACEWNAMPQPEADIIINTTSVGMMPDVDETPVSPSMLESRPLVFDAIYNPIETRLLNEARKAGCVTASGFDWFVTQAAAQFRIWTGREAPREVMADVVKKRLS